MARVEQSAVPPLSDLSAFTMEDGCIDAYKYTQSLDKQVLSSSTLPCSGS